MENSTFKVNVNNENGCIDLISLKSDKYNMNWARSDWGMPVDTYFLSCTKEKNSVTSVYQNQRVQIKVERYFDNDGYLTEYFTLKNRLPYDLFIKKGDVGIKVTLPDSYESAEICMNNRCNAHICCAGAITYINALKMGVSVHNLGLAVIEGEFDSYSIIRDIKKGSNDRGEFILNLSPKCLSANEEIRFGWKIFEHNGNADFERIIFEKLGLIKISAEHYTVFEGEEIKFSVNCNPDKILLDGIIIKPFSKTEKATFINYLPKKTGEHTFTVVCGKKEIIIRFFVSPRLSDLIKARVKFIAEKQQYFKNGSSLDGAYILYDNREEKQYVDFVWHDFNASRERIGMGILIAKYLQKYPDKKLLESLEKYIEFVEREVLDRSTGMVYNNIRRDNTFLRLYNFPWYATFMMELYYLKRDKSYLKTMTDIMLRFYEHGGEKFYPNAVSVGELLDALDIAKLKEEKEILLSQYKRHVDNLINNSTNYPKHEVNYEQTIVAPAATLITDYLKFDNSESVGYAATEQIKVLERFNGHQPDYRLYETSIRHWDGYWFGKNKLYGDTFPHYWSSLSGWAFMKYGQLFNDADYIKMANENVRACLCLFTPEGRASCAYLYPFRINSRKGEYFDDFANDQDFCLYYALKVIDQ